uniref:Uncharacterized protein n=1 Tax=Parascaris equorum TaxID=6256 RepID=A0A914S1K2_PAREQ
MFESCCFECVMFSGSQRPCPSKELSPASPSYAGWFFVHFSIHKFHGFRSNHTSRR